MAKRKETLPRYLKSPLDRKEDKEMSRLTGMSLKGFKKTPGSRTIDRGVVETLNEKEKAMKRQTPKDRRDERRGEERFVRKEHEKRGSVKRKEPKRIAREHESEGMHRELAAHHMREAHKHLRKIKR